MTTDNIIDELIRDTHSAAFVTPMVRNLMALAYAKGTVDCLRASVERLDSVIKPQG